jgi:putative membrane protein
MRLRLLAATALAAAALPTVPARAANAVPTWDRHYLQDTAEGVHFEIDLGKVVLRRSHNKAARAFARRMATDHGRELLALRRLAKQLGVKLPDTPSVAEQHEIGNTTTHTGAAFDRAYARLEVGDHIRDLQGVDGELLEGSHPAVKAFAQTWHPMYREHLALARSVAKQVHAT